MSDELQLIEPEIPAMYKGIFKPAQAARYVAFVEAYFTCFNEKEACKIAGLGHKGGAGEKLLEREDIQNALRVRAIYAARTGLAEKAGTWDAAKWQAMTDRYIDMCMGNPIPVQVYDKKQGLIYLHEDVVKPCPHCGKDVSHMAAMYKFSENGTGKGLELMGKFLKILTDKVEISSDITPAQLKQAVDTGVVSPVDLATYFKVNMALTMMNGQ